MTVNRICTRSYKCLPIDIIEGQSLWAAELRHLSHRGCATPGVRFGRAAPILARLIGPPERRLRLGALGVLGRADLDENPVQMRHARNRLDGRRPVRC